MQYFCFLQFKVKFGIGVSSKTITRAAANECLVDTLGYHCTKSRSLTWVDWLLKGNNKHGNMVSP